MSSLETSLRKLSEEIREFTGINVGTHERAPSPLHFYREYVTPGRPVVFKNALPRWPALTRWTNDYLVSSIGESPITVALTPNGLADAPSDPFEKRKSYCCFVDGIENEFTTEEKCHDDLWFVTPHEKSMKFSDFIVLLKESRTNSSLGVPYAQKQNGSFLDEFYPLVADAAPHLPWASEAFGTMPDAVNFWMGDDRASTWLHKDHYENVYVVISGEKHFTLYPPVDSHRMYIKEYKMARYWQSPDGGSFRIIPETPFKLVPWVSVDPYLECRFEFEEAKKIKEAKPKFYDGPPPLTCTVAAGEMLYLPSLWYHHVRQSPDEEGRTIAINYWYDMQYDIRYSYHNFLQNLCKC